MIPRCPFSLLFARLTNKIGLSLGLLVLLGIVTAVMHRVARPIQGLGIGVPGLVAPLVACLWAWLLCPAEFRAPCVYLPAPWGL